MSRNLCFCTPCGFFLVTEMKLNVDEIFNNINFHRKCKVKFLHAMVPCCIAM